MKIADPIALANTVHTMVISHGPRREAIVALLKDVWEIEQSRHPLLAWNALKNPIVRIAIAQALAFLQPSNDNKREYYAYVKGNLKNPDHVARGDAARALGILGSDEDILELEKLVRTDVSPYVARHAAIGLGFIGTTDARESLVELKRVVHSARLKRAIQEVLEKFEEK